MNAYLVAGLIVGGLAWALTRRSGIAGAVLPLAWVQVRWGREE